MRKKKRDNSLGRAIHHQRRNSDEQSNLCAGINKKYQKLRVNNIEIAHV